MVAAIAAAGFNPHATVPSARLELAVSRLLAAYSFVRDRAYPLVPSALTPSSLGCSRDEHRSARFRTQESNLEFAVQSRASCQLDQSGSVPPEGLEPANHRIKSPG